MSIGQKSNLSTAPSSKRIWELDAWRGVTIVYMVLFHALYDLYVYYGYPVNPHELLLIGPIKPGHIVSFTFFPLAGISSELSRKPFKRGAYLMVVALGFSLVTYITTPQLFIRFGTLHLLSTALLLSPLWRRLPTKLIPALALLIYLTGVWTASTYTHNPWLFPLGLITPSFTTMDYFPIFPYIAPFIMGIWFKRVVYDPRHNKSLLSEWPFTKPLQYLGRHSLLIYIIHQPILMLAFYLLRAFRLI